MKKVSVIICSIILIVVSFFVIHYFRNKNALINLTGQENKITLNDSDQKGPLVFKDKELEFMVRTILKKDKGDIFKSDLAGIKELYIFGKTVQKVVREGFIDDGSEDGDSYYEYEDVNGKIYRETGNIKLIDDLKYFDNLERITLAHQEIEDISVLENFKNLKYINFAGNSIKNIQVLRNLNQLENVDLNDNAVKKEDLSIFSTLPRLKYLDISDNWLYTLDGLEGAISLETLKLNYCSVVDFRSLKDMTKLTRLDISFNNSDTEGDNETKTDISSLQYLKKLQYLNISGNVKVDLSYLKDLDNLVELDVSSCDITDVKPLEKLTNLQKLLLVNNPIRDISPLKGLNKLEHINIGYTSVTDLTPIKGLKSLKKVEYENGVIEEIK